MWYIEMNQLRTFFSVWRPDFFDYVCSSTACLLPPPQAFRLQSKAGELEARGTDHHFRSERETSGNEAGVFIFKKKAHRVFVCHRTVRMCRARLKNRSEFYLHLINSGYA